MVAPKKTTGLSVKNCPMVPFTRVVPVTIMGAGATRRHTETLSIAVYLNISSGELGVAISFALVLLTAAFVMLLAARIIQKLTVGWEDGQPSRAAI